VGGFAVAGGNQQISDEAFAEKVKFWKTPIQDCGDARGNTCIDYSVWTQKWDEIKAAASDAVLESGGTITHHHADHSGSLAALISSTGAHAYIHPLDAPIVRGEQPAPGPNREILAGRLLGPLMARVTPKLQTVDVLHETNDGDEVPAAGGMKAIHTPGHTAGHLSYLWPHKGGVLFAGDAAAHVFGLGPPVGIVGGIFTEDMAAAKDSFRKLAAIEFDIACFGHGGVIKGKAHATFRRKVEEMAR